VGQKRTINFAKHWPTWRLPG